MRRRAVSTIIAEMLLIAMTVALGTIVYSFASTSFGAFGNGFTQLVSGAGDALSEHVIVEQVYFFTNQTGGDLYIRNVGLKNTSLVAMYVSNETYSAPVSGFSVQYPSGFPATPITIRPGAVVQVKVLFSPTSGDTYAFVIVTRLGNEVTAYQKA